MRTAAVRIAGADGGVEVGGWVGVQVTSVLACAAIVDALLACNIAVLSYPPHESVVVELVTCTDSS